MSNINEIIELIKNGGNLPIVENGKIIKDTYDNGNLFIDGLVWIGTGILKVVVYLGKEAYPVFVIVGICGFFIVMAGHKKLGLKITSGSVMGYAFCKVVGELIK